MGTHIQDHPPLLDPSDCWSVIERVAATPSLKRAARLREFLMFVGTQSLKEGRSDIHEQEIGETVFGRPHAYDTSQDNIVRVSATELRKRVEAYFAAEGLAEPIIFEIPRGSYLPTFRIRESATLPAAPVIAPAEPLELARAPKQSPLLLTVSVIAVLLAILCILLWRQNTTLRQRIRFLEQQHSVLESLTSGITPVDS
jgi:hypothetical protein